MRLSGLPKYRGCLQEEIFLISGGSSWAGLSSFGELGSLFPVYMWMGQRQSLGIGESEYQGGDGGVGSRTLMVTSSAVKFSRLSAR